MIKLVIFDFDGVIADSKMVYYISINKHLNPMGFSKREVDKAIDLGMNLSETLKRFIPAFFYRWWIKRSIMKDVVKEINDVRKCKDLSHIKNIRPKKILISNSLEEFVFPVLKHLKAKNYFSEIYCADDFNDKENFIKKYLKTRKIKPNECVYVGDRAADAKLARRLGIHSIIVFGKCAWDSKKEIMKAKPEFIVPDLIDINKVLKHLND
ncbi:MAG: HAD hydrolase-like protein [Candidatus Pacearchaeota archaeon]